MTRKTTSFTIKNFSLSHYLKFKAECALRGLSVKKGLSLAMSSFIGKKHQVSFVKPMLISEIPGHEKTIENQSEIYVQPKLNGWRCMANLRTRKIYRRSDDNLGKEITTMPHINDALPVFTGIEWTDGELYCHGLTLGQIQSGISKGNTDIKFHAFDLVTSDSFEIRYAELLELRYKDSGFQIVRADCITPNKIQDYYHKIMSWSYEGIIIRLLNHPYEQYRSTAIFKKKPVIDPTV